MTFSNFSGKEKRPNFVSKGHIAEINVNTYVQDTVMIDYLYLGGRTGT